MWGYKLEPQTRKVQAEYGTANGPFIEKLVIDGYKLEKTAERKQFESDNLCTINGYIKLEQKKWAEEKAVYDRIVQDRKAFFNSPDKVARAEGFNPLPFRPRPDLIREERDDDWWPIIGSLNSMAYRWENGDYFTSAFHGVMAVGDAFLVKDIVVIGGKLTYRVGIAIIERTGTLGLLRLLGHLGGPTARFGPTALFGEQKPPKQGRFTMRFVGGEPRTLQKWQEIQVYPKDMSNQCTLTCFWNVTELP